MNKNIQRLVNKQNGIDDGVKKQIHIRYYGDLDPSGIKMDKTYAENIFPKYGLYNVDFRRLAVTVEQTNRFHLIHNPDPDTLKKLKADPNKEEFKKRLGLKSDRELFEVQLEAMQAPNVRSYFKNIVIDSVDQFYDQDLYLRHIDEEYHSEEINGLIRKKLNSLLRRL